MARKSNGNSIRKIDTREGLKMRYQAAAEAVMV
jgi:hypothetical protein